MNKLILLKLSCFLLMLNTNLFAQKLQFGLTGGLAMQASLIYHHYSQPPKAVSKIFIVIYLIYRNGRYWDVNQNNKVDQ